MSTFPEDAIVNFFDSLSQQDLRRIAFPIPPHGLRIDRVTVKLMDHEGVHLFVLQVGYEGMPEGVKGLPLVNPAKLFVFMEPSTDNLSVPITPLV